MRLLSHIAALALLSISAGAGSGQDMPLALESSTVVHGETEVETGREIKLVFSKNISNIAVRDNNLGCFTLTDSAGAAVPAEIVLFDDQLERERRNDVVIKPAAMKEAECYRLTVSTNLTAKNGANLPEELVVVFSTPGYEDKRSSALLLIAPAAMAIIAAWILTKRRHAD